MSSFTFIFMLVAFLVGYTVIALEHPLKINKTATALLLGVLLWVCAVIGGESILVNTEPLRDYITRNPGSGFTDWLVHSELIHSLGDIAEILFFLMGAMTIVEVVDTNGGFKIITDHIKTKKKTRLLWIICILTFFMSAVLDNLTTSIVMIALLRKMMERKDRLIFASMVILAANAGGAWSPIGDVTTIMLWIAGDVTSANIIVATLFASIVSILVPLLILTFMMKGENEITPPEEATDHVEGSYTNSKGMSTLFLCVGVGALVCVPVFKTLTHLPPYLGMMGGLGILWILSEIVHRKQEAHTKKYSILSIISRIDLPSILFFLGILLAVNAMRVVGHLALLSNGLDSIPMADPGKYYVINIIIGMLSSIVDNVPLVAGAMGMYNFPTDHYFWEMLAYCAGTGGSILIIGSAAGVAVMGLEKIDFIWYLKHISWLAFIGYIAGALCFIGQKTITTHFAHNENKAAVEMTEDGVKEYLMGNTFYVTSDAPTMKDGQMIMVHDSTTINFIEYCENGDNLLGMRMSQVVTSNTDNRYEFISQSSQLYPGTLNVEIKDTLGHIDYNGFPLTVTQSGRVFSIQPDESILELRKK